MMFSPTYEDETRLTMDLDSADGSAGQAQHDSDKRSHPKADASEDEVRVLENSSSPRIGKGDYRAVFLVATMLLLRRTDLAPSASNIWKAGAKYGSSHGRDIDLSLCLSPQPSLKLDVYCQAGQRV